MEREIVAQIQSTFAANNHSEVVQLLESITPADVMAQSEENLRNTRLAVLYLSKGELTQLKEYTEAAKRDFRDVIYWATLEQKKI